MIQFEKIEDALVSVINDNGVQVLQNPQIMIALLSDYAPEFPLQQCVIRKFIRAGGNNVLYDGVTKKCTRIDILPLFYSSVLAAKIPIEEMEWLSQSLMSFIQLANPHFEFNIDPEIIHQEGMRFFRQFPREQNIPIAISLLCEAGKNGNAESYHYVANCYLKGKGIPVDTKKGLAYLELAVDGGSESAALDLAERYFNGRDVETDHKEAVALLTKLRTSSQAQFMLGEIYSKNQMYQEAFSAYKVSAELENVHGQYAVALCYATGKGVARNMESAKKWLKSAARLGHGEARQKLKELGETWE